MKALILGGGGREHALLYSLKKSRVITEAIAAPGNGGISEMCPLFPLNILDAKEVTDLARIQKIDLVVIGPEAPPGSWSGRRIKAPRHPGLRPWQRRSKTRRQQGLRQKFHEKAKHTNCTFRRVQRS
nr:phosphoribosylamine--glycine ligase N-terminal domain-containing protein [Acetomicrobium hydrogeniformans]